MSNQILNPKKLKYFLYSRKSSESEDRQVQSIDDQILFLQKRHSNLEIVEIIKESKSAKRPNKRPEFDRMVKELIEGKADGIICWELNRLSRNAQEAGVLMDLLQVSTIKAIQTYDKIYLPQDNVLLMFVEFGISTQFSKDLSNQVKRGFQGKYVRGQYPHLARVGYVNNMADHTIDPDPERFDLVRQMWELVISGKATPHEVHRLARDDWGFRTRKLKKLGGKPMSKSMIYRMFSNIFYTGYFYDNEGKLTKGEHKAMITMEEFTIVQRMLKDRGRPCPKRYKFAYTGVLKCGECGCSITAEPKFKYIKSSDNVKTYKYYHCTWKNPEHRCKQRKSLEEIGLEKQLNEVLDKSDIIEVFKDWALDYLRKSHSQEVKDRNNIIVSQQNSARDIQKQLDNLMNMRLKEMISDEEYSARKEKLIVELQEVQKGLRIIEDRIDNRMDLYERAFNYLCYARKIFLKADDVKVKKEILRGLGSNFFIKERNLAVERAKYIGVIEENYPKLEEKYFRIETSKKLTAMGKTRAISELIPLWLGRRGSNPRPSG